MATHCEKIVLVWACCLVLSAHVSARSFDMDEHSNALLDNQPAPFRDKDKEELRSLRKELETIRHRLLTQQGGSTKEEIQMMVEKAQPIFKRIDRLEYWRNQWEASQRDRSLAYYTSGSSEGEKIDVNTFNELARVYMEYEESRRNLNDVSPEVWRALAERFEHLLRKRLVVQNDEDAHYKLRAQLLLGRVYLAMAHAYRARDRDTEMRKAFGTALDHLGRVDAVFKTAVHQRHDNIDGLNFIPDAPGRTHIAGSRSDITEGQAGTWETTRALLAEYWPWGGGFYHFFDYAGLLKGFDYRVLEPFAREDQRKPFASEDEQRKVSVAPLNQRYVPVHIAEEMAKLRTGRFEVDGRKLEVDWEWIWETPTYTVWFTSPCIFDLTAGEILPWVLRSVTLAQCGLVSIGVNAASDVLGVFVEKEYGRDHPLSVGTGLAPSLNAYEYDKNYNLEKGNFSGWKMAKSMLVMVLKYIEEAEMEALFEGLNFKQGDFQAHGETPTTYDGKRMPPVILRAAVLGFPKVPENRYRKLATIVKYWRLDPRYISGHPERYDLSKDSTLRLPYEAAYFADQEEVHEKTWRALPAPHGTHLHVTDLTPKVQVLSVRIKERDFKRWSEALTEGQSLVAVAMSSLPNENQIHVSKFTDGQANFSFINPHLRRADYHRILGIREGDSTGLFKKTEILSEYDVHIMRGPVKKQPGDRPWEFHIDPTHAVDLGRCTARFVSKQGKRPTGRITFPFSGCVKLYLEFNSPSSRTFDLEPEGENDPLLPIVLCPGKTYFTGIDRITGLIGDSIQLSGAYGPAAQKWHTITFNVDGQTNYYAHDKITRPAGAAVFDVRIPISIGRHRITVTAEGAAPVTLTVNRKAPARPYTVDHEKCSSQIEERRRKRERQTEPSKYMHETELYLRSKISYAWACFKAERLTSARAILQEVVDEWPLPADIKRVRMQDKFDEAWHEYNKSVMTTAFRQGDKKGMGEAGMQYLKYRKKRYFDNHHADDSVSKADYRVLAESYERFLDDYILLLDGKELLAEDKTLITQLHADWVAIRRRLGKTDERYEKKRFRYKQEPF